MTTMQSENEHSVLPAGIHHSLEVAEFLAENQPLEGATKYNTAVEAIAHRLRIGEITLDDAKSEALNELLDDTFGPIAR